MYTAQSVYNIATSFKGFATFQDALAKAKQYAKANYTDMHVIGSHGQPEAIVSSNGAVEMLTFVLFTSEKGA